MRFYLCSTGLSPNIAFGEYNCQLRGKMTDVEYCNLAVVNRELPEAELSNVVAEDTLAN